MVTPEGNHIRLVTDLSTFQVRTRGPAIAGVWMVTGNSEFPMSGWNDFIVVVVSWLAGAVVKLIRDKSQKELVHFMDGPYAVEISMTPEYNRLQFRLLAGPNGGRELEVSKTDSTGFIRDLVLQAQKVLDECKNRGWWSADAETLAAHLRDLKRELAEIGETI